MRKFLSNTAKRWLTFDGADRSGENLDELSALAIKYCTDKYNSHWYTPHYHRHFQALRRRALNILEIGVGGYANESYANPRLGGASLRMWKEYFPKSMIYGLDICDKSALEEDRIVILQGDQSDEGRLQDALRRMKSIDIVIDDGSHLNSHVLKTFSVLFPLLNDNGIYVVEDIQTSYWPSNPAGEGYGGDGNNLNNPLTIMGYFKSLVDGLNHVEFMRPGYIATYRDKHIVSMHFYHNMVFIQKGHNTEKSNLCATQDGPG
jgi:hypothetical protein